MGRHSVCKLFGFVRSNSWSRNYCGLSKFEKLQKTVFEIPAIKEWIKKRPVTEF